MSLIKQSVKDYLTMCVERSGKSQGEIAMQAGFERPNIISMIKSGATKLPLNKVGPIARALNIDPVDLFARVMEEYQPDTWESIQAMFSQPILTSNELEILMALRDAGLPSEKLQPSSRPAITRAILAAVV